MEKFKIFNNFKNKKYSLASAICSASLVMAIMPTCAFAMEPVDIDVDVTGTINFITQEENVMIDIKTNSSNEEDADNFNLTLDELSTILTDSQDTVKLTNNGNSIEISKTKLIDSINDDCSSKSIYAVPEYVDDSILFPDNSKVKSVSIYASGGLEILNIPYDEFTKLVTINAGTYEQNGVAINLDRKKLTEQELEFDSRRKPLIDLVVGGACVICSFISLVMWIRGKLQGRDTIEYESDAWKFTSIAQILLKKW